MQFIDLQTQYKKYQAQIDQRMHAVLNHGQFVMGPEIAEVEAALAAYVGVKHCITVSSGTHSLEIALRALGIGPGDEVITVPFTWISTGEVVGLVGAKPVFVDIEPVSYNIDIDLIEKAITPRTKAIMPVSLFGQMPDYARINAIAAKHGIPVIEDAAQSFGATQHGRRSCGVTLIGSTSFFPAKPLGCYGDGGALFTSDDALAEKMRAIRTHGGIKRHHHPLLGTNGRFDTIQAAVLLAKLPHFEWEVQERIRIGARYTQLLTSVLAGLTSDLCPLTSVPAVQPGNTHVYAQYTIRIPRSALPAPGSAPPKLTSDLCPLSSEKRDALGAALKADGIPTAVYYPKCLHEQPVFASSGCKLGDFPESEKASHEVISLPMHPFLSEADQDKIVGAVQKALSKT